MSAPSDLPPPWTGLWLVSGCAVVSAVIGSFAAIVVNLLVTPSGVSGGLPGNYNTGFDVRFLAFFFGVPICALIGASIAYVAVVLRRRVSLGIAAVLFGSAAGCLVGAATPAIASWWLSLPSDTNQTAAIVTVVQALLSVPTVALAVKLPIARVVPTRRGRVGALLSLAALAGLFVGLFVGGEAGGLTALQSPCVYGFSECSGVSVPSAIESGTLLGAWIGGTVGLLVGAVVGVLPPWAAPSTPRPISRSP